VKLLLIFVAAVALFLPAMRFGFVQDDRAVIVSNPAAHSIPGAIAAFRDPYWPRETGAGLYRPVTILSYAVDWTLSGGRPGWFHFVNALWHGLVTVLVVVVLARWLPLFAATAAGFVFAWHPVHVEAVVSVVGRAELLAAAGVLGAVVAARKRRWVLAIVCAALAMFSKEHGVIAAVVILLDRWLQGPDDQSYPTGFWAGLAAVTVAFAAAWLAVGWVGESDAAAVFYGRSAVGRLAVALPAALHAAWLLIWPESLSIEYGPQVLPARTGFSLAALLGVCVVAAAIALVPWCRRRAPAISFAAGLALLSCLPTANILFPSGVVLAERNLYLAVLLAGRRSRHVDRRQARSASRRGHRRVARGRMWRAVSRAAPGVA
jgi:protein O-mannosyl-transferase